MRLHRHDGAAPDGAAPDGAAPDGAAPDGAVAAARGLGRRVRLLLSAAPVPLALAFGPASTVELLRLAAGVLLIWSLGRTLVASLVVRWPDWVKPSPGAQLTISDRQLLARSMRRVAMVNSGVAFWMIVHTSHLAEIVDSSTPRHYLSHLGQLLVLACVWALLDQRIMTYLSQGVAARLLVLLGLRREADRLGQSMGAPRFIITKDGELLNPLPTAISLTCIIVASGLLTISMSTEELRRKQTAQTAHGSSNPTPPPPASIGQIPLEVQSTAITARTTTTLASTTTTTLPATASTESRATTREATADGASGPSVPECPMDPRTTFDRDVPRHVAEALWQQWLRLAQRPEYSASRPCPNSVVRKERHIFVAELSSWQTALVASDASGNSFAVVGSLADRVNSWINSGELDSASPLIETGLDEYHYFRMTDGSCFLAMRRTVADPFVVFAPLVARRIVEAAIAKNGFPYLVEQRAEGELVHLTFGLEFTDQRITLKFNSSTGEIMDDPAVAPAASTTTTKPVPVTTTTLASSTTTTPAAAITTTTLAAPTTTATTTLAVPPAAESGPTTSTSVVTSRIACADLNGLRLLAEETRRLLEARAPSQRPGG